MNPPSPAAVPEPSAGETPPTAPDRLGHFHLRRIDTLRAVAILMVFLLHWYGYTFGVDHLQWKGMVLDPASGPTLLFYLFYPLSFGWMGVPLFFVISGFCIHASTLKDGEFRPATFFSRRFWRIYPPYIAAILLAIPLTHADVTSSVGRPHLWSHLLLIHNFKEAWMFQINPVFWSIAIEVQLYLLYPVLWWLRKRWGILGALKFTLLLSIVSRLIAAFFLTDWSEPLAGSVWSFPTMLWFDWTLGAFLAERYLTGNRAFSPSKGLPWFVLLLVALSTCCKPTAIFTFSIASLFFALICERYLRTENRPDTWLERCFVPIGLCSYSFYLIHFLLVAIIVDQLRRLGVFHSHLGQLASAPIAILILTIISFVAYQTIEKGSIAIGRSLRRRGLRWQAQRDTA
jgi:peptidoglycan/LPS O-acetylase OafA/YrhL